MSSNTHAKKYTWRPFEAAQITIENAAGLAEWCGGAVSTRTAAERTTVRVYLPSSEELSASTRPKYGMAGDYLAKVKDEFRIFKKAVFEKMTVPFGGIDVDDVTETIDKGAMTDIIFQQLAGHIRFISERNEYQVYSCFVTSRAMEKIMQTLNWVKTGNVWSYALAESNTDQPVLPKTVEETQA